MYSYNFIKVLPVILFCFFSFDLKSQHLLEALEGNDEYSDMIECKTINEISSATYITDNQNHTGIFDADKWKSLPYGVYDVSAKAVSYENAVDDRNKPVCERTIKSRIDTPIRNPPVNCIPHRDRPCITFPTPPPVYETIRQKGIAFIQGGYWACRYSDGTTIPTQTKVNYYQKEIISYNTQRCINRN